MYGTGGGGSWEGGKLVNTVNTVKTAICCHAGLDPASIIHDVDSGSVPGMTYV
ncbi:MAG: hypothetical protein Q8P73_03275 [bacterium]|nr:hypothetical protein [bacterium]